MIIPHSVQTLKDLQSFQIPLSQVIMCNSCCLLASTHNLSCLKQGKLKFLNLLCLTTPLLPSEENWRKKISQEHFSQFPGKSYVPAARSENVAFIFQILQHSRKKTRERGRREVEGKEGWIATEKHWFYKVTPVHGHTQRQYLQGVP